MGDKDRVFVAVYFRQAITSDEKTRNELQHAAYHWAIWVEPKDSSGEGSSYDVKQHPAYANIGDPGGWRYNYREAADFGRSQCMLGRIMIGKLPKGVTIKDLHDALQKLPLPRENTDPAENCVTWTKGAIGELQQRNWVEQFNLDRFMDDALALGYK